MKEMIMRNLYLTRKNIFITFGIYVGLLLIGVLIALSAKYGNIAKYADSEDVNEFMTISFEIGILAGVILCTISEGVSNLIDKDYKNGWHKYIISTGVRVEKYVAVNFAMITIMEAASFMVALLGLVLIRVLTGINEFKAIDNAGNGQDIIFLLLGVMIFSLYSIYIVLVSYLSKCNNSLKSQIIKVLPALLLSVGSIVLMLVLEAIGFDFTIIINCIKYVSNHLWSFVGVAFVIFVLLTFAAYLISVRSVRREGRVK